MSKLSMSDDPASCGGGGGGGTGTGDGGGGGGGGGGGATDPPPALCCSMGCPAVEAPCGIVVPVAASTWRNGSAAFRSIWLNTAGGMVLPRHLDDTFAKTSSHTPRETVSRRPPRICSITATIAPPPASSAQSFLCSSPKVSKNVSLSTVSTAPLLLAGGSTPVASSSSGGSSATRRPPNNSHSGAGRIGAAQTSFARR